MPLTSNEALSFLEARLGKVDAEIIKPLKVFTWTRDLPMGNDLDRTVEALVLRRLSDVNAQGTSEMTGRSWIGRGANDLKGVNYDLSASATRVFTGGREAKWTQMDLDRARALGDVSFDTEQIEIINEVFQREANDVAYLGDAKVGIPGLLNSSEVRLVEGSGLLAADDASTIELKNLVLGINEYLRDAEAFTKDVLMPNTLLVSPKIYAKLFSLMLPDAAATNVVDYITKRSIAQAKIGTFRIYAVNELAGAGKDGADRAVLYTPDRKYLKYNVMPVWREKTYDKGLEYCAAYLWRIAELQIRHPESITYIDNL